MNLLLELFVHGSFSEGNKKGESSKRSSVYHNETAEPCYFSSSIYYGGQENYSPRTTADSHHIVSSIPASYDSAFKFINHLLTIS